MTELNNMEVEPVGAIPLSDKWSGYYLTDIEKVGIAALSLGITNPEAIKSLIGLKKNSVRTLLRILEDAEWDMDVAIGYVSHDRQGNLVYNQEAYPNYKRWTDRKTGRPIQEPKPKLDKVHKRVALLLAKIDTPDYLHSAIRGRSYITNASGHTVDAGCVKIDVRKFYPSVRSQAVHHFFLDRMFCSGDVAGILTKLLTVDGHLPTGSSSSPILSYFAYEDMFDALHALAVTNGCVMTVYVDDVVFTGKGATRGLLYAARKIFASYRLHGHKTKLFRPGQPRIITGVAITKEGMKLPNKRQKGIADDFTIFDALPNGHERLIVARRLTGRLFEASQVDPSWRAKAETMAAERDALQRYAK